MKSKHLRHQPKDRRRKLVLEVMVGELVMQLYKYAMITVSILALKIAYTFRGLKAGA